jgi:hypothetical protein
MDWLARIPYPVLIAAAVLIGLAPFVPEPHVVEKIRLLMHGNLRRPLDIFDLVFHLLPAGLLVLKAVNHAARGKK